ncbi:unnamed protein product, partial [marine sediment metagenome]
PKMLISYPSAIPLGMGGKAECFEFKSNYLFTEEEFIPNVNKFLPSGIRFSGLKRLKTLKPSLNKEIKTLIYSIDLNSREIKEALEAAAKEENISSLGYFEKVEMLIDSFLAESQDEFIEKIFVDRRSGKLYLYIKHTTQKNISSQEIVRNVFGIKNPVYAMTREKILFKKSV